MKPLRSPSDVQLAISPWVSGTRAVSYGEGIIEADTTLSHWNELEKAIETACEQMCLKAFEANNNYIVGVETTIDMDARPMKLHMVGKGAMLEPLFSE